MRAAALFKGARKTSERMLTATFEIDDTERNRKALDELKENIPLIVTAEKYRSKRSLDANNYFWKMCDLIAKALLTDKDVIYLKQLSKYGVFTDVNIKRQALPMLKREFRYVQEFDDGYDTGEYVTARCYFGSSKYNSKEMSDLIEGTVRDAEELGIDTLTPMERRRLIQAWRSQS